MPFSRKDLGRKKNRQAVCLADATCRLEQLMTKGTVKWFNIARGYGFIAPDDGSNDAFVHISAVERAGLSSLNEGQKISYEVQPGQNGKSSAEAASRVTNVPDRDTS
jgi:CspA family cold shock protein